MSFYEFLYCLLTSARSYKNTTQVRFLVINRAYGRFVWAQISDSVQLIYFTFVRSLETKNRQCVGWDNAAGRTEEKGYQYL